MLGCHGVLFAAAFLMISGYLSDVFSGTGCLSLVISAVMRPFEYALNKPVRERLHDPKERGEIQIHCVH